MAFFDDLVKETTPEREAFKSIPLIQHVVAKGATKELYVDFLTQAYHHVRFTCPLLETARDLCGPNDAVYRAALEEYIKEEVGHDEWILDDIKALGGDAEAVRNGMGRLPCRVMVSQAFYCIERVTPYGLLGMVHVLEGMSVALAHAARDSIINGFGAGEAPEAFSYLSSHGALDIEHVSYFEQTVNKLEDETIKAAIIQAAKDFYVLYGNIFRDLGDRHLGS